MESCTVTAQQYCPQGNVLDGENSVRHWDHRDHFWMPGCYPNDEPGQANRQSNIILFAGSANRDEWHDAIFVRRNHLRSWKDNRPAFSIFEQAR